MNEIVWSSVIVRWVHIVGAVIAVGGLFFLRFVVMPSAKTLADDAHEALRAAIRRRWAMVYGLCVLLLLGSGLFNYMAVSVPQHRGQGLYHALFGVKFVLAAIVFFVGSVLVGRSPTFEPIRRAAGTWMGLNLLLALIVVALACTLKFIPAVTPG